MPQPSAPRDAKVPREKVTLFVASMGNTRKTNSDSVRQPQALPVERDYVAEVQQRAERLAETAGNAAAQAERTGTSRQDRQVQEDMARLRSEAIHAHRLAEQTEMLAHQNRPSQGTQRMAQTSKQDSGTGRRPVPSARPTPAPGANRMAFNPLHPSMELPPEQLIRLLGLETKKTRKKDARQVPKPGSEPVQLSASRGDAKPAEQLSASRDDTKPAEQLPPPIRAHRSRAASAYSRSRKRRSNLLLPAMAVGILTGLAASGYLFWYQAEPLASAPNTASAVSAPAQKPPRPDDVATSRATQIPKNTSPDAPTRKSAAEPATPTVAGTVKRAAPTESTVTDANDPAWQAEAERQRLRAEAEQRFAERLRQSGSRPAPASPAPVSDAPDPAKAEYPFAAQPETIPSRSNNALEPASRVAAEPESTSSPPGHELQSKPEPAPRFASEPETASTLLADEPEPAPGTLTPAQPASGPAVPLAPPSEQPAEVASDFLTEDSRILIEEAGSAEASQNPASPAGAQPLRDQIHDTPPAPPQPATERVAPQPENSNSDSQALKPLLSEPDPSAVGPDVRVVEITTPVPQADQQDTRDVGSAEPPLF